QSLQAAAATADAPPAAPPAADAPPAAPAAAPAAQSGETVTVSREEFNDLQAQSGRSQTAQRAADAAALEVEEMRHRLTELEAQVKEKPNADELPRQPKQAKPGDIHNIDVSGVSFTDEENTNFGESR